MNIKPNTNNIYTKLKNIQGKSTEILKDNLNKFQGYKYISEYQIFTFLKPLLSEHSLSIHFEDLSPERTILPDGKLVILHENKVEQMEKNWVIQYWKQATLTNCDNPSEQIKSKFLTLGSSQDISKAKGSAETYAMKYFLTKFFMIPVADNLDPDREQITTSQQKN